MTRIANINSEPTCEILRAAFGQVCDPDDWRGPIDCLVPEKLASLYHEAIVFMTGTVPVIHQTESRAVLRLTAIGYRAGPAGT